MKVINFEGQTYIHASSFLAEASIRVLKYDETFAVFNRYGDVYNIGLGEHGLYHEGTRYLSRFEFTLGPHRPLLLSSTVQENNSLFNVDMTNPDMVMINDVHVRRGAVHITGQRFLWRACCYTRVTVTNFALQRLVLPLSFVVGADFVDIFEVRGSMRQQRGQMLPVRLEASGLVIPYRGLDGLVRETRIFCDPPPMALNESQLLFNVEVDPGASVNFDMRIGCAIANPPPGASVAEPADLPYEQALTRYSAESVAGLAQSSQVVTSNERFDDWVNRSAADLQMLLSSTPWGIYPYAGVPWFSTIFGRDGIITALQTLWMNPAIAQGVLNVLAHTQATDFSPSQDAQPGKILHESRRGEMADLGEIPFGRYYGSVDSTPLFVMLAGAYYERTGDIAFIKSIWPNVLAALEWIDKYGDADGDGFVDYARASPNGLIQQGWKDSEDSVFHADGRPAVPPVALCEVQGYVYAAKLQASRLAAILGHEDMRARLEREAHLLQDHFDERFWCEDIGTYAIALDGDKIPCCVRSSNVGHCLYTGIAKPERVKRVTATLMSPSSFTGWGIRTIASEAKLYNPMSYHNGSVWPHDTALCAAGMSRYGHPDLALRVLDGLFDASQFLDMGRMPELFCGFGRRGGEGPVLYPLSCAPQAWAAGAVFMLLQACFGLSFHAVEKTIYLTRPVLPSSLDRVVVSSLRLGNGSVDLEFVRHPTDVGVNVLRRSGDIRVAVIK